MSTVIVLHPHRMGRAGRRETETRPTVTTRPDTRREPQRWEAGSREPGLRLTRRGRRLLQLAISTVVVLSVLAGVLLLSRSAEAGPRPHAVPMTYHVVLPGETLWQIAGEVAPSADRRETVAQLLELNALGSAQLSVGQRIAVPARTGQG